MTNKKNNKKEGMKISDFPASAPGLKGEVSHVEISKNTIGSINITPPKMFQNISEENNSQGFTKTVEGWNISDDGVIIKTTTYKGDNISEALVFVKGHKVEDGKLIKIEHTAK